MKIYFIGERLTMCIVESPRVSIGRQKVFCLGWSRTLERSGKKQGDDKKWTKKKKSECFVPKLPPSHPAFFLVSNDTSRIVHDNHCIGTFGKKALYPEIKVSKRAILVHLTHRIYQTCRKVQRMADGFFHEVGSCPSIDDLFGGFPLAREKPFVITEHFLYSNPGLVLPSPSFCGLSLI